MHPIFAQQRPRSPLPPPSQPVSLAYNPIKGAQLELAQSLSDRKKKPYKNTLHRFECDLKSLKCLPNWEV